MFLLCCGTVVSRNHGEDRVLLPTLRTCNRSSKEKKAFSCHKVLVPGERKLGQPILVSKDNLSGSPESCYWATPSIPGHGTDTGSCCPLRTAPTPVLEQPKPPSSVRGRGSDTVLIPGYQHYIKRSFGRHGSYSLYCSLQHLNCYVPALRIALGLATGPPAKLLTLMRTGCGSSP